MFSSIKEFWIANNIGDKIYFLYALIVGATALIFIIQNICDNPKRKIKFIDNAYKKGNMVVAKMTCLTLHGINSPEYYQAEYMYVVNDKRYFVTYKMQYSLPIDSRLEEMNADMLLLKLKTAMILFYDERKPSKVMSKLEVFTSEDGICKIATPKKNIWRNTEIEWSKCIDLVTYI